jgi:hypothetical protein
MLVLQHGLIGPRWILLHFYVIILNSEEYWRKWKILQYKRSSVFWVIELRQRAIVNRYFEKTWSPFQGWTHPVKKHHYTFQPLKMRPLGCPKRRAAITHWGGAISQKDGDANCSSPEAYQPAIVEERVDMGKSWEHLVTVCFRGMCRGRATPFSAVSQDKRRGRRDSDLVFLKSETLL